MKCEWDSLQFNYYHLPYTAPNCQYRVYFYLYVFALDTVLLDISILLPSSYLKSPRKKYSRIFTSACGKMPINLRITEGFCASS